MSKTEASQSIALVSGASSGIGEETCRLLIEQEYLVVGVARNEARLQELASEFGSGFYPAVLDITDGAAVAGLQQALPIRFSDIEVLINNAGHDIGGRRLFDEGSADQWCDIIETNVQGTIRLTHALIDGMLGRGSGHIVNMGSIAGIKSYATMTAYVSSKYAVHGFSETLRLDYAGRGIRVTEIMPGLVRTGFAQQRLGDEQQAREFYDSSGQCLQPQDVARTVLYALQQPRACRDFAQLVVLPVS